MSLGKTTLKLSGVLAAFDISTSFSTRAAIPNGEMPFIRALATGQESGRECGKAVDHVTQHKYIQTQGNTS